MPGHLGTTGAESVAGKASSAIPAVVPEQEQGRGLSGAVANMKVARHKGRRASRRVGSRASLRQLARAEVDSYTRSVPVQIRHVVKEGSMGNEADCHG